MAKLQTSLLALSKIFPITDLKIDNKMSIKSEEFCKRNLEEMKQSKSLIDRIIESEYRNCLKIETEQLLESLDLTSNCHLRDVLELQEKLEGMAKLEVDLNNSFAYKQAQLEAALNANYFLSDAEKFEQWITDRINKINLENSKGPVDKGILLEILDDYKQAEGNFNTVISVGDMLTKIPSDNNSSNNNSSSVSTSNAVSARAPIDYLSFKSEFQSVYTKLSSSWKTLKNTCDHFIKLANYKKELEETSAQFWNSCQSGWIQECEELLPLEENIDVSYWAGIFLKKFWRFLLTSFLKVLIFWRIVFEIFEIEVSGVGE